MHLASTFLLTLGAAAPAAAQQRSVDLHGDYVYTTRSHLSAGGAGAALQLTWGDQGAPVQVSTSPGLDWTRQEGGGPSQTSLSFDVALQPGGASSVTPYAGASASANWSGGDDKQWSGAQPGLETLAGLQIKLGSTLSGNLQERFGYVRGQEHTLTTRVGVLITL